MQQSPHHMHLSAVGRVGFVAVVLALLWASCVPAFHGGEPSGEPDGASQFEIIIGQERVVDREPTSRPDGEPQPQRDALPDASPPTDASEPAGSEQRSQEEPALPEPEPREDNAPDEPAPRDDAAPERQAPEPDAPRPPEKAPDKAPAPCTTRITYGSAWIKPSGRTTYHDDVKGKVTWDGSCRVDSSGNAYATLSNGWKPYFKGKNCILALDYGGSCASGTCRTRIGYGSSWLAAPNHPKRYDDVGGVVTWDGRCLASGSNAKAVLSNGWEPHFAGRGSCDLAFRYTQCGGLFANPVYPKNCPDPGVLKDGKTYYMACTSGNYGYPIYSSTDLVHWRFRSRVFTSASNPGWASGTFWAPELHKVGSRYVVYFSARQKANGVFAIGAAWSSTPLGPYKDIGKPLVTEPSPGAIDAHYFRASNGKHYVLWKVDGNAIGRSTPIKIQQLATDGLSRVGNSKTILRNTLSWEGALVEGAWIIERGGFFYMFYSGNGYASPRYGVGVARASSPLGPYQKASAPILTSQGAWAGPGHGSIVKGPSGEWVHVYHAWYAGQVGKSPGRVVLVDRIQWPNGWPVMRSAPSSRSQPMP